MPEEDIRDHGRGGAAKPAVNGRAYPVTEHLYDVVVVGAGGSGLRATLGDYVHAAGTCRMGSSDDPLAVVDARCRVIGHRALWVCDASVMPAVPRANTHLPTLMVAERVAAMLADGGLQPTS